MTYRTLTTVLLGISALEFALLVALWRVAVARITSLVKEADACSRAACEAKDAAGSLAVMAETERRKAREFFDIIEGVEKERDTWQRFYRESSQAAGVAQAWLMRDLARIAGQANAYAARLRELGHKAPPVDVDPSLQEVLEDFSVKHAPGTQDVPRAPGADSAKNPDAE